MSGYHIITKVLDAALLRAARYYGDCRTILNEGGAWEDLSASDMAALVENGRKITRKKFLYLTDDALVASEFADSADRSYWLGSPPGSPLQIAWIYDEDEDVHYFFGP